MAEVLSQEPLDKGPQPNPADVYETFEDRHWWYVARRRIITPLVHSLVPPGNGGTIVDVGCGAGANVAAFAGDYKCVGIDVSEDLIAAARRRFPSLTFIAGDAPDDLGDKGGNGDIFLLMDVIEHIKEDRAYFARCTAPPCRGWRCRWSWRFRHRLCRGATVFTKARLVGRVWGGC